MRSWNDRWRNWRGRNGGWHGLRRLCRRRRRWRAESNCCLWRDFHFLPRPDTDGGAADEGDVLCSPHPTWSTIRLDRLDDVREAALAIADETGFDTLRVRLAAYESLTNLADRAKRTQISNRRGQTIPALVGSDTIGIGNAVERQHVEKDS